MKLAFSSNGIVFAMLNSRAARTRIHTPPCQLAASRYLLLRGLIAIAMRHETCSTAQGLSADLGAAGAPNNPPPPLSFTYFLSSGAHEMARKMQSPAALAAKWAQRTAASTEAFKAGVEAVTESPMAKAAANVQRQVEGVRRAADSGKTAAALNAVSMSSWKDAMRTKGAPRIASGATQAQGKMTDFYAQMVPFQENLRSQIDQMPNDTPEARIARMVANAEGMRRFQYRKPQRT